MTNVDNTIVAASEDGAAEDAQSVTGADRETTSEQPELSREARRDERVRTRLRETEAERDRFRDALGPHIRFAVEAQIATRVTEPAALWLLPNLDPIDLLGDDMTVDAEKVDAALDQLRDRLPRLARRFSGSADGGVGAVQPHRDDATWASVIAP